MSDQIVGRPRKPPGPEQRVISIRLLCTMITAIDELAVRERRTRTKQIELMLDQWLIEEAKSQTRRSK